MEREVLGNLLNAACRCPGGTGSVFTCFACIRQIVERAEEPLRTRAESAERERDALRAALAYLHAANGGRCAHSEDTGHPKRDCLQCVADAALSPAPAPKPEPKPDAATPVCTNGSLCDGSGKVGVWPMTWRWCACPIGVSRRSTKESNGR